jgi:ferredoxin
MLLHIIIYTIIAYFSRLATDRRSPGKKLLFGLRLINSFMADIEDKYPDNVPGKYYVDEECIDCDLCRQTAPDNFERNEDEGYSYVYKQPVNANEEELCIEALEGCPVEAIGDDG